MININRGLTLSELLLATAILAFVLCGLLALFISYSFLIESNRNLTSAIRHAQYIMEEIRDSNFTNLESNINTGTWDLSAAEIESAPHSMTALINEAIDTQVSQSGNPLGVRVRVDWNDRNTRARFIELETLLTDY